MNSRPLLALLFLPALVFAAPAAPRLSVAVLPPDTEPQNAELALLMQGRAGAILGASQRYAEVHPLQLFALSRAEGFDLGHVSSEEQAERVGRLLGAKRVVYGRLEGKSGAWLMKIYALNPGAKKSEIRMLKLSYGHAKAIDEGGLALAGLVARLDGLELKPDPSVLPATTRLDEAAQHLGRCQAVLLRQRLDLDAPHLLDKAELDEAIASCRAALELDPQYEAAQAALGFALTISKRDGDTLETLSPAPAATYLPLDWAARFWLLSRYRSPEAGLALLKGLIAKWPGALLARFYQAELLELMNRPKEALLAWNELLALTPNSPHVIARIGRVEAKLGNKGEAVDRTREALRTDPESLEVRMLLAGRYLDGGQVELAGELLQQLAKNPSLRAQALLRLGNAHLQRGSAEKAEPLLRQALEAATLPSQWRIRGRANHGLALLFAKSSPDLAYRLLLDAMQEGFHPKNLELELKALWARKEAEALKAAKADASVEPPRPAPSPLPPEASPFPVDASGEVDLARARPAAPPGFDLLSYDFK